MWTVDGSLTESSGAWAPNDLVIGFSTDDMVPTAKPKDVRATRAHHTGVTPASFVHYDKGEARLWVGSSWTELATAQQRHDTAARDAPEGDRCQTVERYNIHGLKQRITSCPGEAEMSEADREEAEADAAEAEAEGLQGTKDGKRAGEVRAELAERTSRLSQNEGLTVIYSRIASEAEVRVPVGVSVCVWVRRGPWGEPAGYTSEARPPCALCTILSPTAPSQRSTFAGPCKTVGQTVSRARPLSRLWGRLVGTWRLPESRGKCTAVAGSAYPRSSTGTADPNLASHIARPMRCIEICCNPRPSPPPPPRRSFTPSPSVRLLSHQETRNGGKGW